LGRIDRAVWFKNPLKGDKYALVEDTRFWLDEPTLTNGTPAIVTVAEALRDKDLEDLNKKDAQKQLDDIKSKLETAAGGPGTLTFVKVPVIYVGERIGFANWRSAVAYTPGLANLQVINKKLYFPRQFGPRDGAGKDIFEETAKARLADVLFVDDWDLYHHRDGEVHRGTTVVRKIPAPANWWDKQP
jgi:hypothetical protein